MGRRKIDYDYYETEFQGNYNLEEKFKKIKEKLDDFIKLKDIMLKVYEDNKVDNPTNAPHKNFDFVYPTGDEDVKLSVEIPDANKKELLFNCYNHEIKIFIKFNEDLIFIDIYENGYVRYDMKTKELNLKDYYENKVSTYASTKRFNIEMAGRRRTFLEKLIDYSIEYLKQYE